MPRAQQVESLWSGLSDNSGQPLGSGKVYTYSAGTLSNKTTWTDQAKSTPAANPIILDAYGRASIWADGAYKFIVKDSNDNTLYTLDNLVYGYDDGQLYFGGTSAGTGNAQTVTISAITALADGMKIGFKAGNSNSGATTLNVSSLGAVTIKKGSGNYDLATGDIISGNYYEVVYESSGTRFRLVHLANWEEQNVWHRARNAAASADVNLYKLNASDQLDIFGKWLVSSTGHITSQSSTNYDIGNTSTPNLVRTLGVLNVLSANNDITVGTTTSHALNLKMADVVRFNLDATDGHFLPFVDNTYDVGSSSKNLRALYAKSISGLTQSTWSPSYGASGSMTYTTVTTTYARYYQIGKLVFIVFRCTGTTGGTASNIITVTAPVAGAVIGSQFLAGSIQNAGTTQEAATIEIASGGTTMNIRRYNDSNYSLGAGTQIIFSGVYESS